MTRKHLCRRLVGWLPILAILQVILAAAQVAAQTIDWDNIAGGNWFAPGGRRFGS